MTSANQPVDKEALRGLLGAFITRQMEAGKWLLASLLIVNGGAIAALLSNATYGAAILEISGKWFALGVVLAFLSGSCSWVLSDTLIIGLRGQLGVQFYENESVGTSSYVKKGNMAFQLLLFATSVASLAMFVVGAWLATDAMPVAAAKAAVAAAQAKKC